MRRAKRHWEIILGVSLLAVTGHNLIAWLLGPGRLEAWILGYLTGSAATLFLIWGMQLHKEARLKDSRALERWRNRH